METLSSCTEARALPASSVSAQEHLEPRPRGIGFLFTERGGTFDDDWELIEMRSQQLLALMDLEELFANGRLDSL